MKFFVLFCIVGFVKTEHESESSSLENLPRKDVSVVQTFLDAELFYERYAIRNVPLVMKAAVGDSLDQKFKGNPHSFTTYLEVKSGHDTSVGMMSIHQFLSRYEHENIFINTPLPSLIKSQLIIPRSFLCQPLVEGMKRTRFVSHAGEWKEKLKVDQKYSMTCVVSGNAQYFLYNTSGIFSQDESIILDSMQHAIRNGSSESFGTSLEPGDCLFIPSRWAHQRNTSGKHISISLHWTQDSSSNKTECIQESKTDLLSLPFPEDPPMDILSIIEFNELHHFISEYYLNNATMVLELFLKRLPSDKHSDGISEFDSECKGIAEEMFHQMDFNGDGNLSEEDFQMITKEELRELSGRLDDRMADFEDIKEDMRAERKGRSIVEDATSGTDDIRKLIQEGFGELFSDIEAAKDLRKTQESVEIKGMENYIKDSTSTGTKKDEL